MPSPKPEPRTSSLKPEALAPLVREPGSPGHQLDNRMQIAAALYVDMGCKPGSYRAIADQLQISLSAVQNMFQRPRIQSHIRALLTQRFNQLELSSERVMQELATIAFAKVSDIFDEQGDPYAPWMLPDHV